MCDQKLIPVTNGVSVAPNFQLFTQVPLPGRYHALVVDDLNLSGNPNDVYYGEKAGVPNMPVGLYDSTGRLVYTASDRRERHVRCDDAVHQHLQLPATGRSVPECVPVRGQ